MTFHEIKKILKTNGWILIRTTGSFYQYRKPDVSNTIIVPKNEEQPLKISIIKDIEKKTGLSLRR